MACGCMVKDNGTLRLDKVSPTKSHGLTPEPSNKLSPYNYLFFFGNNNIEGNITSFL